MEPALARSRDIRNYIVDLFAKEDSFLAKIRKKALANDLPDIHVPSNVGKMLYLLTKIHRPKRVLEVGTLAGYSTLWLARALEEEGKIVTIEGVQKHALLARENLEAAGMKDKVEIVEGNAEKILRQMIEQKVQPFDEIFLDADKESYPVYLPLLLKLAKSGALLLTDNCIPKGVSIGSAPENDIEGKSIYAFNRALAENPNLESVLMTTIVGENGRIDALGVSLVIPNSA